MYEVQVCRYAILQIVLSPMVPRQLLAHLLAVSWLISVSVDYVSSPVVVDSSYKIVGYIVHTGNVPPVRKNSQTEKTQKGESRVKIKILVSKFRF